MSIKRDTTQVQIEIEPSEELILVTVDYAYESGAPAIMEGPSHKWAPEEGDTLTIFRYKMPYDPNWYSAYSALKEFITKLENAVRKQLGIEL